MTPQGPDPADAASLSDLRRFVSALAAQVDQLKSAALAKDEQVALLEAGNSLMKAEIVELKDEIARLKGLPPRPKFKAKPSGMEKGTAKSGAKTRGKRGRGSVRDRVVVTSEVKLKAEAPAGSRFRGYEDVLVQDLRICVDVVRYRRERWETPDGKRIVADLPAGIRGGFGPELRRFIAAGHFQGQVTTERLTSLLGDMGLKISKRQVVRLLSQGLEALTSEDQSVLRTGLETARWISVDDTSARHAGKNGYVTQAGDDRFAVFRTTASKSRQSFLSVLQAGHSDHIINDAALAMMRQRKMPAPMMTTLAKHPSRRFSDEAAWRAHLETLGFDKITALPDPVKIATEAALWGGICEQGLLDGTVIVSDGAGQFKVGEHALCWVHAERLVHKLQPTSAVYRRAVKTKRSLIWRLYADLKAYKHEPDAKRAKMMRARFDRIFTTKSGYALLDRQLARLHRQKADLLCVLDHPEIPLHTNGSENDIRSVVTKRKISGGTVSEAGRIARDTMMGLMKTCAKLNVSFYQFLGDRFQVPGATPVPSLPSLIRLAAA